MTLRNKGIIAYGTEEDREKLAILADAYNLSASQVIIRLINEKYAKVTNDHQNMGES